MREGAHHNLHEGSSSIHRRTSSLNQVKREATKQNNDVVDFTNEFYKLGWIDNFGNFFLSLLDHHVYNDDRGFI